MDVCSVEGCVKWVDRSGMCFAHYYRVLRTGSSAIAPKKSTTERFWEKVEFTEGCWLWTGALHSYGHGSFRDGNKSWKAHRWAWEFINGPIPSGLFLDHLCRVPNCVRPEHLEPVFPQENVLRGRTGNPSLLPVVRPRGRPKQTTVERFWSKVEKTENCWLWTAGIVGMGYGQFRAENRRQITAHRFAWELANGFIPEGMSIDHLCRTPACVRADHLQLITPSENSKRSKGSTVSREKTHCPRGHEYNSENTQLVSGRRHCRACKRERVAEKRAKERGPDWVRKQSNGNTDKTHCLRGHPFEGDNLFVSGGRRRCRICHNANARVSNAKRRAQLREPV